MIRNIFICILMLNLGCTGCVNDGSKTIIVKNDSLKNSTIVVDTVNERSKDVAANKDSTPVLQISTNDIPVDSILNFSKSLIGTPYKYGSIDPAVGFDCSGFITYVYNHFNIKVPRSSIDFTNVGEEIPVAESKKGDLILFRGTDSTERFVGHMGIIVSNDTSNIQFIHSTSGKAYGVVITPLNDYYMGRFVKVVRIGSPL